MNWLCNIQFNSLEYVYCILPDDGPQEPEHVKVIIHISFVLCFDGFNKENLNIICMPEQIVISFGMYTMLPEAVSKLYSVNPCHH
jgi:hypothetical protein